MYFTMNEKRNKKPSGEKMVVLLSYLRACKISGYFISSFYDYVNRITYHDEKKGISKKIIKNKFYILF